MLSAIAALSGLYDTVVGAFLLFAADRLATLFGVPPASPPIFTDLNAVFLLAVGAGYYFPWRDPGRYRGYLWVMGPFLKGAGALLFVTHYMLGESPASFLLFALSDGTLAIVTLWALLRYRPLSNPESLIPNRESRIPHPASRITNRSGIHDE